MKLRTKGISIADIVIMAVLFALLGGIYYYIANYCASDIYAHSMIAQGKLINLELFAGNFLFYLLANIFSGLTGNIQLIVLVVSILLAIAGTAKYYIATHDIQALGFNKVTSISIGLSMLIVFCLPLFLLTGSDCWYFGYLTPNVWHNSTVLFLMPFAILLYFDSLRYINRGGQILTLILLTALNIWIKPSFFFIFVCAYPVILLQRYHFSREFWRGMIPLAIGTMLLILEYLSLYYISPSDDSYVYISFKPIFTSSFWIDTMPKVVVSLLFPFVVVVTHWKEISQDREAWFCLLMLVVALGIWFVCHEGGTRATHGNFYWQIVPITWLIFFYCIKKVALAVKHAGKVDIKNGICLALYGLHVLTGIAYLLRLLILKDYY